MKIFITYDSEKRQLAEKIYYALIAAKHEPWLDVEELPTGGDYRARLTAAITKSDALVFLASARALAEGSFTLTELKHFQRRWRNPVGRVVTVVLDGVSIKSLPAYLSAVTILEQKGAGDLATEVMVAVNDLREARPAARNWLPVGAVALVALAFGAWLYTQQTRSQRRLDEQKLAERRLNRAYDSTVRFLASVTRRPVPLLPCNSEVARVQSVRLHNNDEVRNALAFLRDSADGVDASGAMLDSTNLQGFNFSGANLRASRLRSACIDSANFADAELRGAHFEEATGTEAVFKRARLDSSHSTARNCRAHPSWARACVTLILQRRCLKMRTFATPKLAGPAFTPRC